MPVEIEAKLKVESLDPVRARLKDAGAKPAGRVREMNVFFDTDDRSLLASDEGLRLRRAQDVDTGRVTMILTYKGPRQRGLLKSREEIEVSVNEWDDAIFLFGRLGYAVVLSFEKRRESWTLDDVRVELDELPHLGAYVEIEGPGEAEVLKAREALGLADRGIVKASYAALLGEYVQEHAPGTSVIRFT